MTPLMLRSLASERDSNPSTLRLPDFTLSSLMKISPAAALDESLARSVGAIPTFTTTPSTLLTRNPLPPQSHQ